MVKINPELHEFRNIAHQILAAVVVNIAFFGHGCIVGWVSPAILHLTSDDAPLPAGPLTLEQVSWVGSMAPMGALLGSIASGYVTSFIGCKRSMLMLSIPSFLFWLFVAFGDSYYYLLLARFSSGFAGGGFFTNVVLFVAEISNDNIRGALGTVSQLARNIGILVAYIAGYFFTYETIPFLFMGFPIIFLICFSLLPNTPQFYLIRKQYERAENSLKFYKGCKGKTFIEADAISKEFERLKNLELERALDKNLHWKDLCEPKALKGLTIGVTLTFLNQMSGCFTFLTYASSIFAGTNVGISPNSSAILLAIAQLIGNLLTTKLADTLGRKILIIISLAGCALGLLTTATYLYLEDNGFNLTFIRWTPVITLSFSIFISSVGLIPLTTVCTIEVLPQKIRTFGMALTTMTINLAAFIVSKLFPILSDIIHMYGCFTIMAIICIIGIFFVHITMKETKGQCLDDIGMKPSNKN